MGKATHYLNTQIVNEYKRSVPARHEARGVMALNQCTWMIIWGIAIALWGAFFGLLISKPILIIIGVTLGVILFLIGFIQTGNLMTRLKIKGDAFTSFISNAFEEKPTEK